MVLTEEQKKCVKYALDSLDCQRCWMKEDSCDPSSPLCMHARKKLEEMEVV